MRRTGDQVRAAILSAAEVEFAEHGRSGARIDRIAKAASASKERLYAYFADKDALFAEVVDRVLERIGGAVPLNARDLPQYTVELTDWFQSHPADVRLAFWVQLDGNAGTTTALTTRRHDSLAKVAAVADAQEAGHVDPSWDPAQLLQLLLAVAVHWALSPDGTTIPAAQTTAEREAVRRAAHQAAVRLTGRAGLRSEPQMGRTAGP